MKADALDLTLVLGVPRQLIVPIFQRPYVWEEKTQWEPFWQDVASLAQQSLESDSAPSPGQGTQGNTAKPHFLGAIVLDEVKNTPTGKPNTRLVIDGQQRLITLQLLLKAIKDCIKAKLAPNSTSSANSEIAALHGNTQQLLFNDYVTKAEDRFKVVPINSDEVAFKAVVNAESEDALKTALEGSKLSEENRIVRAYRYFRKQADEWLALGGDDATWMGRATALVHCIRQKVKIVVIDTDQNDEAQVIFETLNARGTPLLEIDLVKNYLFRQAKNENKEVENLYNTYWKSFESADEFWREEIAQGRLTTRRVEMFLHHYLTVQLMNEVSSQRLFDTFKKWAVSKDNTTKDSEWHLDSLQKYAKHFKAFLQMSPTTVDGAYFDRLKVMETTTVFPVLLEVYVRTEKAPDSQEIRLNTLKVLESYLVRRSICNLGTKNYNKVFLDLLKKVRTDTSTRIDNVIIAYLRALTADAGRWPDDVECKKAWSAGKAYRNGNRARLGMILLRLEDKLPADGKSEGIYITEKLTIEHILPQEWREYWPLPEVPGETNEQSLARQARRDSLLHTIGNLSLLTQPLNSAERNYAFADKMKSILKHSKLKLNIELSECSTWSETEMENRAKRLWDLAKDIWPCPSIQQSEKEAPVAQQV